MNQLLLNFLHIDWVTKVTSGLILSVISMWTAWLLLLIYHITCLECKLCRIFEAIVLDIKGTVHQHAYNTPKTSLH